jgi:uncharacterized protein (DUF2062 family)
MVNANETRVSNHRKRTEIMIKQVIAFGKKMILSERTPTKLAFASSVGIFIACSPFLGLHWLMTIVLSWLLRLNVAVVYAAAHVINNPFTMIPLYIADYEVGKLIVERLLGLNLMPYNPSWMNWLNVKLACLGIPNLSLWTFLIGGNILGLALALITYPLCLHFFRRIKPARQNSEGATAEKDEHRG